MMMVKNEMKKENDLDKFDNPFQINCGQAERVRLIAINCDFFAAE